MTWTITSSGGDRWKFCPQCGHKLEAEWKHCPECGLSVGQFALPYTYVTMPFVQPLTSPLYYPAVPGTSTPAWPSTPIITCGDPNPCPMTTCCGGMTGDNGATYMAGTPSMGGGLLQ